MAVEITGQKAEVTVGEKISLGVKYTKEWGILKSVEWIIPGNIVKNYTDGLSIAKVTKIEEADKKRFTINFYWVDKGDNRLAEAKCVFTSAGKETNKTVSAKFDVKAPTLDKFDAKTDKVDFTPDKFRVRFGVTKAGIKWNWKVTVPGTVDGYVKDVQTIQDITKRTKTDGTKQVWTITGTKIAPTHVQLDTENPYSQTDIFPKGFPAKVSAGGSYSDNYTSDSPGTPVVGTKRKFVHDKFKYYIMYKPDKPDAIWVPVGKAEWYWKAEVVLIAATGKKKLVAKGKRKLVAKVGGLTSPGTATTEFPEYRSNVKYNQWQNE